MRRRKFTKEFKISILSDFNSGKTIAQISAEKSISPSLISKWRREYKQDPERAFVGEGKISSLEADLSESRRVIGELYLQVEFLKKVQTNLQTSLTQQRLKKEEDFTR